MKTKPQFLLATALCFAALGCDSDDTASDGGAQFDTDGSRQADGGAQSDAATRADGDVQQGEGTGDVLCDLSERGEQRLVYVKFDPRNQQQTEIDETLPYTFEWACADGERVLTANGVPNHGVAGGQFATELSAQNVTFTFTTAPVNTGESTVVKEPGYALNGIKFDPATAGTCPDDAVDDSDCNYAMGSDTWRMVATPGNVSPWKFGFGVDENDAHVQPTGAYHYHGNPVGLVETLNPAHATSMTLVGWATDGFPIYSIYGHSDAEDAGSALAEMRSSYQLVDTPAAGRPDVSDFPLGHFSQDWAFVEGSGDLDACNGRFDVTPEFPAGIYHYYITQTYPFVQRCVKGESAGGGGGGPGGGGMMPPPRP